MDSLAIVLVVGAVALAALLLGWWIGRQGSAPLSADLARSRDEAAGHRTEAETWRARHNEAVVNLAAEAQKSSRVIQLEDDLSALRDHVATVRTEADRLRPVAERATELDRELRDLRREKEELARAKAAYEEGAAERQQAHAAQLKQMGELRAEVEARFKELASQAVDGAHQKFLEHARERFGQHEKQSEEKLKSLLQPVEASLKQHRELIDKVEAARTEAYGNLAGVIGEVRAGQEAVRSEAAKLVNSLRSAPKARGRWGEQQLRNVLETCGLSEHCDFQTEVSTETEEGRMRPDVIVKIPGGKTLVIDAKVSLNAYQDAFAAVEEAERSTGLASHAAAMKAHVNGLGNKAYWAQFAEAPDYVIMFVPGEHFLSAALEKDPALWDFAFDKRVLLATPTNLIAIARTVAVVWRQEKMAQEAQRIGQLGKEMYDRLAVAAGKLKTVGTGLGTAVRNYNEFVSSFEGRVLVTGRRFRDLNVEVGAKEIEDLPPLDALPRYSEEPAATLLVEPIGGDAPPGPSAG